MPWPVIPFSQITGISGRFYPIYQRWPPETLQVFLVGGGGSSPGGSAGGGGGGGIIDQAFTTGLKPSGQPSYGIQVGGAGATSSFNGSIVAAAGGSTSANVQNNLTGGTSCNGNPGGTGSGRLGPCYVNNYPYYYAAGGGGGAHSGRGSSWTMIGNDYYLGGGAFGYTVSAGVANAIGQSSVGHGGGGSQYINTGSGFYNFNSFCGHQCRAQGTTAGGGLGINAGQATTNGSVYGAGGGGFGGSGAQGVVVISYAGTQASPSGTVSSYGGYTYHVFTAANATLEL
jgi:hypothetical protein